MALEKRVEPHKFKAGEFDGSIHHVGGGVIRSEISRPGMRVKSERNVTDMSLADHLRGSIIGDILKKEGVDLEKINEETKKRFLRMRSMEKQGLI